MTREEDAARIIAAAIDRLADAINAHQRAEVAPGSPDSPPPALGDPREPEDAPRPAGQAWPTPPTMDYETDRRPMTDRDELRRLAEVATPGPWRWSNTNAAVYLMGNRSRCVMAFSRMGMSGAQPEFRNAEGLMEKAGKGNLNAYVDAALIVAMRNALPELLDDLDATRERAEKAERERDEALATLARVEAEVGRWDGAAEVWVPFPTDDAESGQWCDPAERIRAAIRGDDRD